MTISTTTRLGVTTWDSSGDQYTRAHLHDSHTNLENRAATFQSGASLPTHTSAYVRGFYLDTTAGVLYYSNGTAWVPVNSFGTAGAITPGDTASAGAATSLARSDHRHSMLPFATATPNTVSTTASAGAANTYARGDHQHILGANSVVAGNIAAGAIASSTAFAAGVVNTAAIADANVTRNKIEVNERIPTGTILPFVGSTAPAGWAICDGTTAVSAASELGILLGGASGRYGTSGGNPLVPNLVGKFPYGGYSGGSAGSWTNSGGAGTVTLAANNLPAHQHGPGTLALNTVAAHQHGPGTLTTSNADLTHAHTFAHYHNVDPVDSNDIATDSGAYGTCFVLTPGGTGGQYTVSSTNGNANTSTISKIGTWLTNTQSSTITSGGTWASNLHLHSVSTGVTDTGGSHTHTFTGGTTDNNTTTNTAFSILPPFVGLNFIIKL